MKEKYTEYAKQTFKGKALDLVLNNINLFYEDNISINKSKYKDGEDVFLKSCVKLYD